MGIFYYLITKIKFKIWRVTFLASFLPLKLLGWPSSFRAIDDLPCVQWDETKFNLATFFSQKEGRGCAFISIWVCWAMYEPVTLLFYPGLKFCIMVCKSLTCQLVKLIFFPDVPIRKKNQFCGLVYNRLEGGWYKPKYDSLWSVFCICSYIHAGIWEIVLSVQGGSCKMYRIYKKILHSDDFVKKWYVLEEILKLISSSSLKMREVSHVCSYKCYWENLLRKFNVAAELVLFKIRRPQSWLGCITSKKQVICSYIYCSQKYKMS